MIRAEQNGKRIRTVILALVLAVAFMVGCDSSDPAEYSEGDTGRQSETVSEKAVEKPSEAISVMSEEKETEEPTEIIIERGSEEPTEIRIERKAEEPTGIIVEREPEEEQLDRSEQKQLDTLEKGPQTEAVYLGVKDYGAKQTNKDNKDSFLYRFEIDGLECVYRLANGALNDEGKYDYPLQNRLKEGYRFYVAIENDVVTAVEEIHDDTIVPYEAPVKGMPGERTLKNFLKTALEPVGTALYIYGGGWDWQDEGSSVQARMLGVSTDWVKFYESKDASFTYKEKDGDKAKADPKSSYYPYGGYNEYYYAGLDCSGFLGWALYNTFETEDMKDGYVGSSTNFAKRMSEYGWGDWSQKVSVPDGRSGFIMKPGDVMSINGHVWISLGTCGDGSVVILHSTPSKSRMGQPGGGVQLSAVGYSEGCEAFGLAKQYMSAYYPGWYERYPVYLCDPGRYYTFEGDSAGRFSWDTDSATGLKDPDKMQEMEPDEILKLLFSEGI